MLGIE